MIPKIVISRPKINADYCCPNCKKIDIVALADINVTCKNCRTKLNVPLDVNITFSVWKNLMQLIAHHNEVKLVGEIYSKDVINLSDSISKFGKHDDDIYSAMLAIKDTLDKHGCWEVSTIVVEDDIANETKCKSCGYCLECKTCKSCGHNYTPKEVNSKEGKIKRFTCPKCGSKAHENKRIEKVLNEKGMNLCPHCKTDNIIMTNFSSTNTKCTKCHTTNIEPPRKIKVYMLSVRRQKRNELPELEIKK